jgi:hypothetical protein
MSVGVTGRALSDTPSPPGLFAVATRVGDVLVRQWRPIVVPALVLWFLGAVVSVTLLHPYDVTEYARYAHAALHHPVLHHFPLEYPAPALVVFVAPLVLGFSYPWAFAVVAGVALLATLLGAFGRDDLPGWDAHAAARLVGYLALGAVMVVVGRYDIFAAGTALMAMRSARRGRFGAAWTWCSVGFAIKLFPAAMWPVLLIGEWRRTGRLPVRRLWWVAGSMALVAGVPALFDHHAVLTVLRYYTHRPAEFGGVASGLSVLLDPGAVHWVQTFHSANVLSPLASPLATTIELGAGVACVWAWRCQVTGRLSMQATCLATLTFVVLGSKVLSVQYLMWLMPFWALYRLRWSWIAASVANLAIFPYVTSVQKFGYVHTTHAFWASLTLIFFARDVLILAGTVAWLRETLQTPSAPRRERESARAPAPPLQPATG